MKIKICLIFIVICSCLWGQNIKDTNKFMSSKNERGESLQSLILPFRMYDCSNKSDKFVSITVVGCVKRPGVYVFADGVTLEVILKASAPIKKEEHPIHALGLSFLFRDKGFVRLDHDANKNHKLLNGDVVYVENSVF